MKICPCGSGKLFMKCCKPYLTGKAIPITAEALMCSRYTAYTRADIDYIQATMKGTAAEGFNAQDAKIWAQQVKWNGLQVMSTTDGGPDDNKGSVSFLANYTSHGEKQHLHENSLFEKTDGRWYYIGSKSD